MNNADEITLDALLESLYAGADLTAELSPADQAFRRRAFEEAATLYAALPAPTAVDRAKHGFALAMAREDTQAEFLLTVDNVGTHPVAQAVLAAILAGPNGRRLSGFGSPETQQILQQRRATVNALLEAALSVAMPPQIVFRVAFEVWGTYGGSEVARTVDVACHVHPAWDRPHALRARGLRVAGQVEPAQLDDLLRFVDTSREEEIFHEAYAHALLLERFDDATRVVDALHRIVHEEAQPTDSSCAALDEMRAMIDLRRARAGDASRFGRLVERMQPYVADSFPWQADRPHPLTALKFLLEIAVKTADSVAMAEAAGQIVERVWSAPGLARESLQDWSPLLSAPGLSGVLHFGHFGFDFGRAWREIDAHLTPTLSRKWQALIATDAVCHGEPDADQISIARSAGHEPWLLSGAFSALVDYEPADYAGAGHLLADWSERSFALSDDEAKALQFELEMMPVDGQGSEDVVAIFEGALAWLQMHPTATGRALLHRWKEVIADNGGCGVLARIAMLSLSRGDSEIAQASLAMAKEHEEETEGASELEQLLARYPDPAKTRVEPKELTLLEAATLIALLRASAVDHVHWTLAPLQSAGQPFEPTQKFIGTLFALMSKGVIAVHPSTPAGVIEPTNDGRLRAHLQRVVWRISPHTLELQRQIRSLPHDHWPTSWRSHAPALSRDLGVEEVVAYLEHLLDSRDLPAPDMDDVRTIARVQLEHLAIAQVYYLAHKTIRETLDYQARYRPGTKQLQSRLLNLLRGNGEKAIANGWDTRFERLRELPASLLFEALHDVLTGWGVRAFEQPVMSLLLDEDGPSATRH